MYIKFENCNSSRNKSNKKMDSVKQKSLERMITKLIYWMHISYIYKERLEATQSKYLIPGQKKRADTDHVLI